MRMFERGSSSAVSTAMWVSTGNQRLPTGNQLVHGESQLHSVRTDNRTDLDREQ
ncbi:MAG: hypothetical protein MUO99_00815 [Dehalococcoidales bacterium]|nr:hypothetical protein [Dehalococcoidales bacterium]